MWVFKREDEGWASMVWDCEDGTWWIFSAGGLTTSSARITWWFLNWQIVNEITVEKDPPSWRILEPAIRSGSVSYNTGEELNAAWDSIYKNPVPWMILKEL